MHSNERIEKSDSLARLNLLVMHVFIESSLQNEVARSVVDCTLLNGAM